MPFAHCRLPIRRHTLLWCAAHSVTHLMCAPSFAPSTPRLPKNILRSPTFARTRATDYSHTSHRLLGGEDDVLCFFCRHQRRRRLPYSLSLQSVQGRTPACGNRSFPHAERGAWGASPPHSRVHAQQIIRIPATGYLAARMTCCVFFAVIYDAGDYPILSAYRACRDARRRVETGVSPCDAGGVGGIPPTFARTRATDSSHTSHRLLGGEDDGLIGFFYSLARTMSAAYSLSGKARKERGKEHTLSM